MKTFLTALILFIGSSIGMAQNTVSISGTIEPGLIPSTWAYSTATAILVNPTGTPPVYKSGGSVPRSVLFVADSGGNISGNLPNNNAIIPPGTSWKFTVCPFETASCQTLPQVTITASYDVTSYMNQLNFITVSGDSNYNIAYSTANVYNPKVGTTVTLIPSNQTWIYSPTDTWTQLTAPAVPTGPAGGDLSGTYPNPSVAKVNGSSLPLSSSVVGTDSSGHIINQPNPVVNSIYVSTGGVNSSGGSILGLNHGNANPVETEDNIVDDGLGNADFITIGNASPGTGRFTNFTSVNGNITNLNSSNANISGGIITPTTIVGPSGIMFSSTAPTIASGFGSTPSIAASNGTAAFTIHVSGTPGSGVLTFPAATTGWNCTANQVTVNSTSFLTTAFATSSTTVDIQAYSSSGSTSTWANNDYITVQCVGR